MLKFLRDNSARACDGTSRRELLEVGGISALGLSWPDLMRAQAEDTGAERVRGFGSAKSVVVVFLFGGPSQQDMWDMKPRAPAEARGDFKPIATNVVGTQIGECLPRLAKQADKFTIIRSVSHTDFEHGSASFTALTGHPHPKPGTNTPATRDDFPAYGCVVSKVKPTPKPVPDSVVLGPVMHQGNRPPMAGQHAGFLGTGYDPFRIAANPNLADFKVTGLGLRDAVTSVRMKQRGSLLSAFKSHAGGLKRSVAVRDMDRLHQRAFGLLVSTQSEKAFNLRYESAKLRDQYGRSKFGQTMLLARRLVEAEVPLVTVNWAKKNNDQWDTHAQNYPRLRKMAPAFDQGFAAFLADLQQRDLLKSTLVICLGEFGRTPKMNKQAGRDHWPDVYSVVVAGGGLRTGEIYGSSDRLAAYPQYDPIGPWDIAATMFHCLGIVGTRHIHDRLGRPFRISPGRVEPGLLV